jgi:thiamine biosynthesis lipoprotein
MTVRDRFGAMGTTVEVVLDAPDGPPARAAIAAVRAEFARLEDVLSRFRPGSEVSRLNRVRRMRVGPDLLRVVQAALRMRRRTGGRFDPTVGAAVAAAGYDRTWEEVADDPRPPARAPARGAVVVDARASWIALGPGAVLDLGAIAKGDAADRACALLAAAGPCLVSAGGDVAVSGPRADGGPWDVGVAHGAGTLTLALWSGGLATSGVDRRRWRRAGAEAHHEIDPATGRPAATCLLRATAVAATAAEADALATGLLVAGGDAADLAGRWGVPAALVARDGTLTIAGGLE